jgi:hypothetical protein
MGVTTVTTTGLYHAFNLTAFIGIIWVSAAVTGKEICHVGLGRVVFCNFKYKAPCFFGFSVLTKVNIWDVKFQGCVLVLLSTD